MIDFLVDPVLNQFVLFFLIILIAPIMLQLINYSGMNCRTYYFKIRQYKSWSYKKVKRWLIDFLVDPVLNQFVKYFLTNRIAPIILQLINYSSMKCRTYYFEIRLNKP